MRTRERNQTRLMTTVAPVTATESALVQAEDLTLPPGLSFPTAPTEAHLPAQEMPAGPSPWTRALASSQRSSFPPLNPQCQQKLQLPLKHLPQRLPFQLLCPLNGFPRGSSRPSRPSSSHQPLLNKLSDPCKPSSMASTQFSLIVHRLTKQAKYSRGRCLIFQKQVIYTLI